MKPRVCEPAGIDSREYLIIALPNVLGLDWGDLIGASVMRLVDDVAETLLQPSVPAGRAALERFFVEGRSPRFRALAILASRSPIVGSWRTAGSEARRSQSLISNSNANGMDECTREVVSLDRSFASFRTYADLIATGARLTVHFEVETAENSQVFAPRGT